MYKDHEKNVFLAPNSISTNEIKCKFSHHFFSTNHKGEDVHNSKTVNYFNSLYRFRGRKKAKKKIIHPDYSIITERDKVYRLD